MSPRTIGVVDDAPELRSLLRLRLRLTGAFTVVAEGGTGHDAVAIARDLRPDLLLLDVSMPGMGGLDAIRPVLEASPGTRVVLYSGFSEEGLESRALALGATAFLQKSADVDELLDALVALAGEPARPADGPAAGPDPEHASAGDAERILGEHVESFRAVFDQAAIGIGTLTLTGQIVRANPALAELLATPPLSAVGLALQDVVPPGDRDGVALALATALREGAAQVEHRLAGTDRLVTSTLAAVRDSQQRPLYLLLQSQDIDAQRTAERALVASEERFRLLVDSVVDYAIFMLDPQGRIATWNRGAERLKGYRADEIVGRHFRTFYTLDAQTSRHPEAELAAATHEGRYQEEGWRIRKDGTRFWANVTITALRGPGGELLGFAKVTRDVTAQRRASLDLERSASELADANTELTEANLRLGAAAEERAHILAVTAHELRSPIAVVAGAASTLHRRWGRLEEDERTQLLASVESSAEQMRRMLNELLLATRLDAGAVQPTLVPVRLRPHLERAVARLGDVVPGAGGAVGPVAVDCPDDLEVRTDPERLEQIVENYLTNAARYGAPPVRVVARADGDAVALAVEDHGPGVPDALLPHLFDEMFLRGASRRGTGLGLYIVRRLARALGGDAWHERDGAVTRFGAHVPRA
ncbi:MULTISPECIES: PAS domain S-box protein [unclassified Actinotalea]|uniref:PAS domain S-box protein n=1 Tax=unclassified Actinotalea TaxID=2638618 RepID=UPI0015F5C95F|nr:MULTISPECIES: PAS domain S-box protein [unclassified Actinotalea]